MRDNHRVVQVRRARRREHRVVGRHGTDIQYFTKRLLIIQLTMDTLCHMRDLLTVCDILLVVYVLECIYHMSESGTQMCDKLAHVPRLIGEWCVYCVNTHFCV